jgi:hypothetical protein
MAFLSTRKHARALVFRFRLRHAQALRISLFEVSPACRRVASFRRHGHRGLNIIRVRVKISGVRLRPGTYRITVRNSERIVMKQRFVVARSRPSRAAFLAALHRDACAAARSRAQLASFPIAAPPVLTPPRGAVAGSRVVLRPGGGTSVTGRVLGELTAPLGVTPAWLRPILLAVFGLALALLLVAALPQTAVYPRSGPAVLLARHRGGLAAVGVTLLACAALAVLLT